VVFVFTRAYNAEKTLRRAMDSVLKQTCPDLIYYVLDNGSTDGTWDIMQDYAARDNRIRLLRNEKNTTLTGVDGWKRKKLIQHLLSEYNAEHYHCTLDADDEYEHDFLEKSLSFMEQHNLDIVACGSDYIDVQTNNPCGIRKINNNLIIEGRGFSDHFPTYIRFMRTVWGKVYSFSLLRKCTFNNRKNTSYINDTLSTMELYGYAARIGILEGTLHKYYISNKSVTYKWDPKRLESSRVLYDEMCAYLTGKCGGLTLENDYVVRRAYISVTMRNLIVMFRSDLRLSEKLRNARYLLGDMRTKETFRRGRIWWIGKELIQARFLRGGEK